MTGAKAIAFLAKTTATSTTTYSARRTGTRGPALILVPTTCGTEARGNGFAVLTNPETGDKKSLRTNAIVAKASIIDSDLMRTMPKTLLADRRIRRPHTLQGAYISKIANPISECLSLQGMDYIGRCLVPLYEGSEDPELWDLMTAASTLGGMVIHMAGVTLTTAWNIPCAAPQRRRARQRPCRLTPLSWPRASRAAPRK
jgi:alcohol dehydrogenase class IV